MEQPVKTKAEKEINRLREVFDMFDLNNTGKIDTENLGRLMNDLGYKPSKEDLRLMINDMDIKGAGYISFDDFVKVMNEMKTDIAAELKEAFKSFDLDKSGKISFEELRLSLAKIGERLSDDQIRHMMKEADKNGDGEIDLNEFIIMFAQ